MAVAVVTVNIDNSVPVVTASGEIDVHTSSMLVTRFEEVPVHAERVIFDFSGVSFLDSSGLGALVACQKRLVHPSAQIQVVVASGQLVKLFSITGLDKVFRMHARLEEALAAK